MSAQAVAKPSPRSRPKIILVTSNKGGTGKTTTSVNLACAAAHAGWDVGALDFDTQHNLENWGLRRRKFATALPQITIQSGRLDHHERLLGQMMAHDLVIIDTPPGVAENLTAVRKLIDVADFVLIPTQTGLFDLETTVPWAKSIQPAKRNKVAFIMNRVNQRSVGYRDALAILNEHGRVCGMSVRDLTSIERQMGSGHSVLDSTISEDKGKKDYLGVWTWVEREIDIAP